MRTHFARNALTLGLLSAIGPFAIDMYLPALPTLGADLNASTFGVQMTLMAYFVGFGFTQIIYGPVSDMVGRKPPLYFGLAVFAVATLGAALATSIEWLIAFRIVQGIGAAAAMVIPRAVIRDLHTGVAAARLMSLVMLVFSVSPILAPLAGSALIVPFGWRAVFYAVAVTAVIGLALVAFSLPETRPPSERVKGGIGPVLSSYGSLLQDWHFMSLTIIGALGISSFMVFLATSSFIYIDHFGLTPMLYSLTFSLNAIGFIGAAQFSALLGQRFGMGRVILGAVSAFAAMAMDFSRKVQAIADSTGKEMSAADIWSNFEKAYHLRGRQRFELIDYDDGGKRSGSSRAFTGRIRVDGREIAVNGRGNGLISSAVSALNNGLQMDVEIVDYHEHALRRGSDAQAAAYVECRMPDDRRVFGVGIDDDVATASVKALLSAFNAI